MREHDLFMSSPVVIRPVFVCLTQDMNLAALLAAIADVQKMEESQGLLAGSWWERSDEFWGKMLGLSRRKIAEARAELQRLGLVELLPSTVAQVWHYRLDWALLEARLVQYMEAGVGGCDAN